MTATFALWRHRLFATPLDSLITVVVVAVLAWYLPGLVRWGALNATFTGDSREACTAGGACWALINARMLQFLYGFYPISQYWRINVAGVWLALIIIAGVMPASSAKRRALLVLVPPFPIVACILLIGGVFGLPLVETREWGGLTLTIVMTLGAGIISFPLSILLALGRYSSLPFIRIASVGFIEFWRGVPIVAVIFLASILLPLILPEGMTIDKLLRAIVGLGLVVGAYMAEVVRGGLQALPKGQGEAAQSLGLNYWQSTAFIILPQALRISIPGLTNESISLFKNTTLVLIVSLFDLLGIVQASMADPKWVGLTTEAYTFAGLVYWFVCFAISRYGLGLERRLAIPGRR